MTQARKMQRFVMLLTLALGTVCATHGATAAMRQCQPGVTSEIVQGATEILGKQRALLSWTTKAFRLGVGYASWRLADKKVLGCKKSKAPNNGFSCVAYAMPCTILQAPGQPSNPGQPSQPNRPKPRPGFNSRNAPVET